jgi:parallel beta-helix repeat protein
MHSTRAIWALACGISLTMFTSLAVAKTLCVNTTGSGGCFKTIQGAVNGASANDVIQVAAGTYKEFVAVGKPLSIIGAGSGSSIIDATGLVHGIFVDGFDHPGLNNVTIAGLTIKNALFEGLLVVSASDVTIRGNQVIDNDTTPGLAFTGAETGCPGQPGDDVYENNETGDCGGGIHLIGTIESTVANNLITGNADGILISDETAESRFNLITGNTVKDNPLECGIVLASHAPIHHVTPPFARHFGVDNNTVSGNISMDNGVQVGGAGVGFFSDGAGQGRVSGNVAIGNQLVGNGLGGVALHTHVGPAFGFPADDMTGNMIIGNFISGNLADQADTATPGRVGININSGDGASPVHGTVISRNVIEDEDVDIAVNTPAEVDLHLNNLLGGKIGVADVCVFDKAKVCTGNIDATEDYWGCTAGPGGSGCTTKSGSDIRFTPWLSQPITGDDPD